MSSVFAQKTITIKECLESTFDSFKVKSNSRGLSILEGYNYNLPFIKSINLRSETRDFIFNQQEYSIRVKPNSLKAISLQKKVYKNRIARVEIDNQLSFNEELKKRYLLIVDYFFTKKIIKLIEKKRTQEKDKLKVLSNSIYNLNFDIKDLIESEEELLSIELKLANLKELKIAQQYQLRQLINFSENSLELDFEDLISPEQIFSNINYSTIKDPIEITKQKLRITTLKNEMELEKTKSNRWFDFFQVKFVNSKDVIFNENFSIGLGLKLPFFDNNRIQKGDLFFQKLTEESLLGVLKEKVNNNHVLVQKEFENAVNNYKVINKQFLNSSVSSILERYKKMEGVSPILLLNLMSSKSKKELEVLESKQRLYTKYIEALANQGRLFDKPLRNYLSSNIEYITN